MDNLSGNADVAGGPQEHRKSAALYVGKAEAKDITASCLTVPRRCPQMSKDGSEPRDSLALKSLHPSCQERGAVLPPGVLNQPPFLVSHH